MFAFRQSQVRATNPMLVLDGWLHISDHSTLGNPVEFTQGMGIWHYIYGGMASK